MLALCVCACVYPKKGAHGLDGAVEKYSKTQPGFLQGKKKVEQICRKEAEGATRKFTNVGRTAVFTAVRKYSEGAENLDQKVVKKDNNEQTAVVLFVLNVYFAELHFCHLCQFG